MTQEFRPLQPNPNESSPIQIQSVLDKLRTIGTEIFADRLNAKAQETDPLVGIAIVPLPDQGSVVAPDGQEYKFYVARVEPGKHVNPHVHFNGDEPYRLVTGEEGIMHLGTIEGQTINWRPAEAKSVGDEIIVHGGEVHSFENTGNTAVDFTFASPDSHLNSEDRVMTTDYQNPFPQYKQ